MVLIGCIDCALLFFTTVVLVASELVRVLFGVIYESKCCVWITVRASCSSGLKDRNPDVCSSLSHCWTISLFRFWAFLQHVGFLTQLQTKQNKLRFVGTTWLNALQSWPVCGLNELKAWEAPGCSFLCVCLPFCDKTREVFVLNQAPLSLTCSVMGKLPKCILWSGSLTAKMIEIKF